MSRFQTFVRVVSGTAAFFGALIITAGAIGTLLPLPDVPNLAPKLRYLAENRDRFDTLFLGSSRVYHQILPSVFDEVAAAHGVPTRAFNLGLAGMRPPEDGYVFDQVRKLAPEQLRWVCIEAGGLRFPIDGDKRGTIRAVYWHDLERTLLLLRFAFTHRSEWDLEEIQKTSGIALEHLGLFFERFSNVGRAELLTDRLVRRKKRKLYLPPLGENLDGFRPTGQPEEIRKVERQQLAAELAARDREPAEISYHDETSQIALDRLLRQVRALEAVPILIIPPTTASERSYPARWIQPQPLVLDFSDRGRYPELFDPKNRLDHAHLNVAGGRIFSRLLASEFAAVAKALR